MIELLVVMSLAAVLMTLGAAAVRNFWFVRSLEGGKNEVVTELRALQQRVIAASNPVVYGAMFTEGSEDWEVVQYRRDAPTINCNSDREVAFNTELEFDAGVEVQAVEFTDYTDQVTDASGTTTKNVTQDCLGDNPGADGIAWFFARGSATPGSVTIEQPNLGRTETVCVSAITGRVDESEDGGC